jgi:hypothetical protein
VLGRAFVAPLALLRDHRRWMEEVWLGASFGWQRADNLGEAAPLGPADLTGNPVNALAPITTQGGFTLFNGSYDNPEAGVARTHLSPDGDSIKWALEANLPFERAGVRFELVRQSTGLAVWDVTNPSGATPVRERTNGARFDGLGYYIEAYAWLLGDSHFVPAPGLESAPRRGTAPEAPRLALMIAARYEHVGFDVTGLPLRAGMTPDIAQGHYQADVFALGLNFWATAHVRVSGNYVLNYLDGDALRMKRNLFFEHPEHELMFRLQAAL